MENQLPRETISRPGEPTDAPPGSTRKIRVLTERASRREALFHPKDNLKRRLPVLPRDLEEGPDLELEQGLVGEELDTEDLEEEELAEEPYEADIAG
jgi:hypothetical protein